ncbi:MAG: hypothetical protein S4CHLAM102_03560 [Chlamydiia bacterium]|nr:hypothetical protein [Chlamydiia bacterium]
MLTLGGLVRGLFWEPLRPAPEYRNETRDGAELIHSLRTRNFVRVINDQHLFWLAFCKAHSSIEGQNMDQYFSTTFSGSTLILRGRAHIVTSIEKFVEVLRGVFTQSHANKRGITMVPVGHMEKYFLREEADTIDRSAISSEREVGIHKAWYHDYIQPSMQRLCESIGAVYSEVQIRPQFTGSYGGLEWRETVTAFKIDWVRYDHLVYPIEPLPLPPINPLSDSLYTMYQDQILCDLSLLTSSGPIKVHSSLFYASGGEVIQKMLTCEMQESLKKEIDFSDFNYLTIKALADFLYLGEKGLEARAVIESGIDCFNLFELAHLLQIHPLIAYSSNLITLRATHQDLERIEAFANQYNYEHLHKLHWHLKHFSRPAQAG